MLEWEDKVGVYKEGQRMLERQRFQLPSNWLHIDSVEGEWSSFSEILKRKDSSIQTQVASLQAKILSEDKAVETRTGVFLGDWEKEKPVKADFKPTEALRQLLLFETRYTKLKEERGNVSRAKEALEMTGKILLQFEVCQIFSELMTRISVRFMILSADNSMLSHSLLSSLTFVCLTVRLISLNC